MIRILERYWILVYIVQIILALVIVVKATLRGKGIPLEKIAIMILIPIFGLFIPFIGVIFHNKKDEGDLDDIFDHGVGDIRNDIRYERMVEFEKEVNYVPLDEALLLNDSRVKRELLLDVSKEDTMGYLGFLRNAMVDKDMETSHYAASMVMEINSRFQEIIQGYLLKYRANPNDVENLKGYVNIVGRYYHSGLLDNNNERRYANEYSHLLSDLLTCGYYTENLFKEKINLDIKLNNLAHLFEWIALYKERYPESEWPYLLMMKYHYSVNDTNGIRTVLKFLDDSYINKTLEGESMIQYWKTVVE